MHLFRTCFAQDDVDALREMALRHVPMRQRTASKFAGMNRPVPTLLSRSGRNLGDPLHFADDALRDHVRRRALLERMAAALSVPFAVRDAPVHPEAVERQSIHAKRRTRLSELLDWRNLLCLEHRIDQEWGTSGGGTATAAWGPRDASDEDEQSRHWQRDSSEQRQHAAVIPIVATSPGDDVRIDALMDNRFRYIDVDFGTGLKRSHFFLIPEGVFLNAGSYGATPRGVVRAAETLSRLQQSDAHAFLAAAHEHLLPEMVDRLARFVDCDAEDLVFLPNCNTGTSTVLKSIPWEADDRILILSCDYDATIAAVHWLAEHKGVQVEVIHVRFPLSTQRLLADLRLRLQSLQHLDGHAALPKLANFCHVTSKSAWIFPVREMVAVCHEFGVPVLIDGAHAPGHLQQLSLREIGADFYCGTCHKWMFSLQGVAFLTVSKSFQPLVEPLVPLELPVSSLAMPEFHGKANVVDGRGVSHSSAAARRMLSASAGDSSESTSFCDRFRAAINSASLPAILSLWTAMDFADYICGGWQRIWRYQSQTAQSAALFLYREWRLADEGIPEPCIQWHQVNGQPTSSGDEGNSSIAQNLNCMPLCPIPRSRGATEKDAKRLMGFLLTRFNITCFIVVAQVWVTDAHRNGSASGATPPSAPGASSLSLGVQDSRSLVNMLVLRFTSQVHVSLTDVATLASAVKALQMTSSASGSNAGATASADGGSMGLSHPSTAADDAAAAFSPVADEGSLKFSSTMMDGTLQDVDGDEGDDAIFTQGTALVC